MSQLTIKADITDVGKRIDIFVAERAGLTRSASQKVLADGHTLVNGSTVRKNYKIAENEAKKSNTDVNEILKRDSEQIYSFLSQQKLIMFLLENKVEY